LAFVAGCTAGSAITGLVIVLVGALVSPIPSAVRIGLAVAGTVLVFAAARGVKGLRLPQTQRQIPSTVVALRRPANAWRFAVTYGTGLATYLPSSSPHVLVMWLVLVAPSATALATALAFGVGRGLGLLARSCARHRLTYEDSFQRITAAVRPYTPVLVTALVAAATFAA
jgi:hypothetical protein